MKIRTKLYYAIPKGADEENLVFKWKLFSCALPVAPDRQDHKGKSLYNTCERILTLHADVKVEGEITLDLREALKDTIKTGKRKDGTHGGQEIVPIAIVFKMGSERGTIVVEAYHGKKMVGTAKINYAKTHARQIVSQSASLLD